MVNTPNIKKKRLVCKSQRLQAQRLTLSDSVNIIWINCYFPCDPQTSNFDPTELIETLSEVENLVISNSDCETLLCGDLNYAMDRNNNFTKIIDEYLERLKLRSAWHYFKPDFTHRHTEGHSVSTTYISLYF